MSIVNEFVSKRLLSGAAESKAWSVLSSTESISERKEIDGPSYVTERRMNFTSTHQKDFEDFVSYTHQVEKYLQEVIKEVGLGLGTGVEAQTKRDAFISSSFSSENEDSEEEVSWLAKKYVQELTDAHYEDGFFSSADEYALGLMEEKGEKILHEFLNASWVICFSSKNFTALAHFLNSIKNLSMYTDSRQFKVYAVASLQHKSIKVKDAAMALFEEWDDPEDLPLLENLDGFGVGWLEEYKNKIIEMLKRER